MSYAPGFTRLSSAAALCFAFAAPAAQATVYTFTQGGYSGGGSIAGTFTGIDLNGDGQIDSRRGEVTAFSLGFSGDSVVGPFSHSLGDLSTLVYDIGSGSIGDVFIAGLAPGIASNWYGSTGVDYASGLGPTGGPGGRVIDVASGNTSTTVQSVLVTAAVPEPGTAALFALGLAGFGLLRRRGNED